MTEAKNVVCSRLQKGRFQITVEPSLCMAFGSVKRHRCDDEAATHHIKEIE